MGTRGGGGSFPSGWGCEGRSSWDPMCGNSSHEPSWSGDPSPRSTVRSCQAFSKDHIPRKCEGLGFVQYQPDLYFVVESTEASALSPRWREEGLRRLGDGGENGCVWLESTWRRSEHVSTGFVLDFIHHCCLRLIWLTVSGNFQTCSNRDYSLWTLFSVKDIGRERICGQNMRPPMCRRANVSGTSWISTVSRKRH